MLILSLHFWRRADSTCFVSHSAALIFHSTEIKKTSQSSALSPITQYINILAITIIFFSPRIAEVWQVFPHSFLWGHFQLWPCYCSSICAARGTVHIFKLLQLSYFSAFQPFQLFQIFIFLPSSYIQLYVQLEKVFSYQSVYLFKLFQPS